jgi:hypothetical protein
MIPCTWFLAAEATPIFCAAAASGHSHESSATTLMSANTTRIAVPA